MLALAEKPMTTDWTKKAEKIAAAIAEHAAKHDADDSFVTEGFSALEEAGFFTALVPQEFGGGGATISEVADALRIIGAACSSTALAASMHSHIIAVAAWRFKNQGAPTDGLLKRVVAEKLKLVSSGGSDWLSSAGTMEKVEGGYKLTARKAFASGSTVGSLLNTSAVYDDPEAGPTVLHFGAPLKGDGVRIEPTWQTLGMRGTGSDDVVFDGLFIPDAAIAGKRPQGQWHMLFHVISMIAFGLIYSAYLGVAEGARNRALAMARKRPQDPLLAQTVGEMENRLLAARLAHRRMIEIAETGTPGPETTSEAMQCRTLAGQAAIDTVTKAMEVAGGAAFYRKTGLERAFRDIQAARFHPLQEKPQLDLAGRVALGWDIDG
ncbi:MAG TPA: acyl-CoA dehydrogenase family protein [Sphingomicrobium sp.]|nr:acyl-CoA dehydrogenase family protein [Sphingomicrobium sp.]